MTRPKKNPWERKKSKKIAFPKTRAARRQKKVTDVMTKKIIVVNETSSLGEAAQIFLEEHISHLPILKEKKLIGIVSKTDVLKAAGVKDLSELSEEKIKNLSAIKISDVMKKPIYVSSQSTLRKARGLMEKFQIGMIPVLDREKRLMGIITRTDLMKVLSKSLVGKRVQTTIDELLKTLEEFGSVDVDKLSKIFGVKPELIEEWGKILEEHGLATLVYPTLGKPYLKIAKKEGT